METSNEENFLLPYSECCKNRALSVRASLDKTAETTQDIRLSLFTGSPLLIRDVLWVGWDQGGAMPWDNKPPGHGGDGLISIDWIIFLLYLLRCHFTTENQTCSWAPPSRIVLWYWKDTWIGVSEGCRTRGTQTKAPGSAWTHNSEVTMRSKWELWGATTSTTLEGTQDVIPDLRWAYVKQRMPEVSVWGWSPSFLIAPVSVRQRTSWPSGRRDF